MPELEEVTQQNQAIELRQRSQQRRPLALTPQYVGAPTSAQMQVGDD